MGNLVVAATSVMVPLFNRTITVPFFYHPYRWGTIPWHEPNPWIVFGLTVFFNIIMLSILGTISGMMSTMRECRKYDFWESVTRSFSIVVGYIVASGFLFMFPMIKAPFLSMLSSVPYASYIVQGFLVAPFILIVGAISNQALRKSICNSNE